MRRTEDYQEAAPHADKIRKYRIGRWVTDCRLAKGWTMVDVAMRLHMSFPHSHLGNQGRISELETGNGVKRERWTPEILQFLYSLFQPCPPLPHEPWALTPEYEEAVRREEAAREAKRAAEAARLQAADARRRGLAQLGMDLMWSESNEDGERMSSTA